MRNRNISLNPLYIIPFCSFIIFCVPFSFFSAVALSKRWKQKTVQSTWPFTREYTQAHIRLIAQFFSLLWSIQCEQKKNNGQSLSENSPFCVWASVWNSIKQKQNNLFFLLWYIFIIFFLLFRFFPSLFIFLSFSFVNAHFAEI